jgi:hypothetical protein
MNTGTEDNIDVYEEARRRNQERTPELVERAHREELMISVCSFCATILGEQPVDSGKGFVSHGLCEECLEEHYPAVANQRKV